MEPTTTSVPVSGGTGVSPAPQVCDCGGEIIVQDGYRYCKECSRLYAMQADTGVCPYCKEDYHWEDGLYICPKCGVSPEGTPVDGFCPGCQSEGFLEVLTNDWVYCSGCGETFKKNDILNLAPREQDPPKKLFRDFAVCPECGYVGMFYAVSTSSDSVQCDNCEAEISIDRLGKIVDPIPSWSTKERVGCYRCGHPYQGGTPIRGTWTICPQCDAIYYPVHNNHKPCECFNSEATAVKSSLNPLVIPLGYNHGGQRWWCTKCKTILWEATEPCPKCTSDGVISPTSVLGGLYQCTVCGETWLRGGSRITNDDDDTKVINMWNFRRDNLPDSVRRQFLLEEEI